MTDGEAAEIVKRMTRDELMTFWDEIREANEAGKAPAGWKCRGKALEYCFVRAFSLEAEELGVGDAVEPFNVVWPDLRLGVIEQIDGVVYAPTGRPFLIECKAIDPKTPIDVEPLSKLRFRLQQRPPGTMGLILSLSGFTSPAQWLARFATPLDVLLWSAQDFDWALRRGRMFDALEQKYRRAVELRVAYYQVDIEEDA